ncbi:ATP-dependent DNA helicase [Paramuricea clavata]|uniref:ATP-dependent DNA helicase n=1 Tax=Paramuricea clavata TaxID=317549 RepID=A0A6S7IXX1_PARCT|nr:ATP-dependent DNA helicase [Paramuricea clavata]
MLQESKSWRSIENKDEYEYPGFYEIEMMYHTPDYKAKPFAVKNRVHYMYDDIQLSRSSTQTQLHEVTIDGVITKLHIRRSACEGVKVCSGNECKSYTVSNRQRINRCHIHKNTTPLKQTGHCPVQFVYVRRAEEDGRRWIGVVNEHNHDKPVPHKISTKIQEDIQMSALANIRSTAKDLAKGLGIGYVPSEKSIAAVNIDRIRRERRLGIGSILHQGGKSNANALATIVDFPNIRNKAERSQDMEDKSFSMKVNELMGNYQMEGAEYIFTSTY